jgi:hypothetical protein
MIELTILAVLNLLMNWGRGPVIASRVVAADAILLRALLVDPASQARAVASVSALLRPGTHDATRGTARVIAVPARFGHRDVLWLTWILTPRCGTTELDLAAQLESEGLLARLALLFGGRRWLRHRLETILGNVAAAAHSATEDLPAVAQAQLRRPSRERRPVA